MTKTESGPEEVKERQRDVKREYITLQGDLAISGAMEDVLLDSDLHKRPEADVEM